MEKKKWQKVKKMTWWEPCNYIIKDANDDDAETMKLQVTKLHKMD